MGLALTAVPAIGEEGNPGYIGPRLILFGGATALEVNSAAAGTPAVIKLIELMVVDFTASWCGPCRFIAPILAELARKHPEVIFVKVDVDELKQVASDWAIEAMPTFMFLKEGKIVDTVVGAKKEELQQTVAKHVTAAAAATATA